MERSTTKGKMKKDHLEGACSHWEPLVTGCIHGGSKGKEWRAERNNKVRKRKGKDDEMAR